MRKIKLIGAPFGLGSHRPLTANAPQVLRHAGLIKRLVKINQDLTDQGDLDYKTVNIIGDNKLNYLTDVKKFSELLLNKISEVNIPEYLPIVIGGDHSISIGTMAGLKKTFSKQRLGLIWIDAHPDLNTPETTPSGNIHGMSVAALLGLGASELVNLGSITPKVLPEDLVFIGLRDVDPGERKLIKEKNITAFTMNDVDELGIGEVMRRALLKASEKTSGFLASFDLDVCDPLIAPGVGTPVRGGLTFREAHYVMEKISEHNKCIALELVEFNPGIDSSGNTCEMMISLLESAVGKRII